MRVVAIDFETANASLASACSLGISIYDEGEIVDTFEWLIKPHSRYNFFTNTDIHMLKEEDVENEEEFLFYYDQLAEILKDSLIIAHNARFDIGVLNAVCDVYGLEHFHNRYADTVAVSRKVFPELYHHKLNNVCDYLGIDLSHHNAQSDSFGCLMILLRSMEIYQCYDVEEFLKLIRVNEKENF